MSHAARCAHHWQMAYDRYSTYSGTCVSYRAVLYCALHRMYVQRQGTFPRAGGGAGCGRLAAGLVVPRSSLHQLNPAFCSTDAATLL